MANRASLPIVNLRALADGCGDELAKLDTACRETGFLYLAEHGVDSDLIARVRSEVADYFSRPLEAKLNDQIARDNYRGYIPARFFTPNDASETADDYEGYKLHFESAAVEECDLYGPNRWPAAADELRDSVSRYWQECDRLAITLLIAFARIIGADPNAFVALFEQPLTNMTLLHYSADTDRVGIHPHKDTDALTILATDDTGGLFVRRRDGQWIEAGDQPDMLVVNIGDMLEIWSGGRFVSTPHKVENRSGRDRYSFPYFAVPRWDVVIKPICELQDGFEPREIHSGDSSRAIWRSNWPDAAAVEGRIDPGVFNG